MEDTPSIERHALGKGLTCAWRGLNQQVVCLQEEDLCLPPVIWWRPGTDDAAVT